MAFSYWFCWALGALAAEAHLGRVRLPDWLGSPLLFGLGLTASYLVQSPLRDFLMTCSFFPVILWITRFELSGALAKVPGTRALIKLGAISYGVYLIHEPAFVIVKQVLVRMGLPSPLVLAIRFASGLIAGYAVYRFIERPFMRRSQQVPVAFVRDARANLDRMYPPS